MQEGPRRAISDTVAQDETSFLTLAPMKTRQIVWANEQCRGCHHRADYRSMKALVHGCALPCQASTRLDLPSNNQTWSTTMTQKCEACFPRSLSLRFRHLLAQSTRRAHCSSSCTPFRSSLYFRAPWCDSTMNYHQTGLPRFADFHNNNRPLVSPVDDDECTQFINDRPILVTDVIAYYTSKDGRRLKKRVENSHRWFIILYCLPLYRFMTKSMGLFRKKSWAIRRARLWINNT